MIARLRQTPDGAFVKSARRRAATQTVLLLALLAAFTVAAFLPVSGLDFVNIDDDTYVTANRHVTAGLGWDGARWAFTSVGYAANWHPLTWLSHQIDASLFGLAPGSHHLVNLLFHTGAVLLFFLALRLATGSPPAALFAAALFAVHPLRVESVAWVAERKDVLSAFFWMLTTLAYVVYARRPRPASYAVVLAAFILGLLAKPMLVSLPLVLLLLDYWPLGRWGGPGRRTPRAGLALVTEKAPLLLLAACSGIVTYRAQRLGGGLVTEPGFPLGARLENAALALVSYLEAFFVPVDLAVFYPFPGRTPALETAAAAAAACAVTAACLLLARRRPWLIAGWLWYLVVLLPVLGIVQVGLQSRADRYTYLPSAGLGVLLAWEAGAISRPLRRRGLLLAGAATAVLLVLVGVTRHQLSFWRGSESLFRRALAVTSGNWLAENNLGQALHLQKRYDEAIGHFRASLAIRPGQARSRVNLGNSLAAKGQVREAIAAYDAVLREAPDFDPAWFARGNARAELIQFEAAAADFRQALALRPDNTGALTNLGVALLNLGRYDEALACFRETLRLDPALVLPRMNTGLVLFQRGLPEEARPWFEETLRLDPDATTAHYMLGLVAEGGKRTGEAAARYREVLRRNPGDVRARARLDHLARSAPPPP